MRGQGKLRGTMAFGVVKAEGAAQLDRRAAVAANDDRARAAVCAQLPSQRRLSPVTLAIFCWFWPCAFET